MSHHTLQTNSCVLCLASGLSGCMVLHSEAKNKIFGELEEEKFSKLSAGAIKHRKSAAVAALLWKRLEQTELSNL